MDIGSRIKKLRKELDLTQSEFASRIGSVQNTVTGYESGRRSPSAPVISLICREFNINEEWLRNGTGEMFKAAPNSLLDTLAKEYNYSHRDYVIVEKFSCLSRRERDAILDFLMEVAKGCADVSPEVPSFPVAEPSNLSIDERVEAYRQALKLEQKAAEKSEVS